LIIRLLPGPENNVSNLESLVDKPKALQHALKHQWAFLRKINIVF